MSEEKFTQDELQKLFGNTIPIEAVNLLWNSPDTMTIGEVRAKLREMAGPWKRKSAVKTKLIEAFTDRWPTLQVGSAEDFADLDKWFDALAGIIVQKLDGMPAYGLVPFGDGARQQLQEIGNVAFNMRQMSNIDPTVRADAFKTISDRAERLLTLVRNYPL